MRQKLTKPTLPIALILIAALGSICFALGAGVFLYRNTRSLITAKQWVEHTQDVLLSLQQASQLVQRIDDQSELYVATHNVDRLQEAKTSAIRLKTLAFGVQNLVADNSGQTKNVQQLIQCVSGMSKALSAFTIADPARVESLNCQQALSLMAEQEHDLLQQRASTSEDRLRISVLTEISVVVVSLFILIVLFASLLRDVLVRAKIATQLEETNLELEKSNQNFLQSMAALESHTRQASLLATFRDELQLCSTSQQVYCSVAIRVPQLLPGTSGALCIIDASRHSVETVSSWGEPSAQLSEMFSPDSCCGLRGGHLRWRSPEQSELDCNHFVGTPPLRYACAPLVAQGETLGVLFVEFRGEDAPRSVELHSEALLQLVQLTAMAHASIELRRRLENQSIRDSLTGLFNRHFMQLSLDRELARCTRRKRSLAVFMIDVDHFKTFNDRFSHAAGDTVLKEVARKLRDSVRNEDVACRYGGEEFTIILPEMNAHDALEKAETLRRSVEKLQIHLENSLLAHVTISIGVAVSPDHGMTSDSLLRQADASLYQAKHDGRNRVFMQTAVALDLPSAPTLLPRR
jgi:diguanylate cyclase (GGDEF)-like protein